MLSSQVVLREKALTYNDSSGNNVVIAKCFDDFRKFDSVTVPIVEGHPVDYYGNVTSIKNDARGVKPVGVAKIRADEKTRTLIADLDIAPGTEFYKGMSPGMRVDSEISKTGVLKGVKFDRIVKIAEIDHIALTDSPRDREMKMRFDSLNLSDSEDNANQVDRYIVDEAHEIKFKGDECGKKKVDSEENDSMTKKKKTEQEDEEQQKTIGDEADPKPEDPKKSEDEEDEEEDSKSKTKGDSDDITLLRNQIEQLKKANRQLEMRHVKMIGDSLDFEFDEDATLADALRMQKYAESFKKKQKAFPNGFGGDSNDSGKKMKSTGKITMKQIKAEALN